MREDLLQRLRKWQAEYNAHQQGLCSTGRDLHQAYERVPVAWHTAMTSKEILEQHDRIQEALRKYNEHVASCLQCQAAEDIFYRREQ